MIERMNAEVASLKPLFEAIDWSDANTYGLWLSQCYYITKHSTGFLGLCLFHASAYPEFQKRCTEHIREEDGHQKLALNDLKNLGVELCHELPATAAIYQTQYYKIVAESPLSFLGYIFALELLAPAFGGYVMNRIPNKKTLSFLKVHTVADEDHIEHAKEQLLALPPKIQDLVYSNFLTSISTYRSMLEEVHRHSKTKKVAA